MGRVSQNMMLAAAALGVGSCPITLHRHDDARAVLGCRPITDASG
jgi:nitroreductase